MQVLSTAVTHLTSHELILHNVPLYIHSLNANYHPTKTILGGEDPAKPPQPTQPTQPTQPKPTPPAQPPPEGKLTPSSLSSHPKYDNLAKEAYEKRAKMNEDKEIKSKKSKKTWSSYMRNRKDSKDKSRPETSFVKSKELDSSLPSSSDTASIGRSQTISLTSTQTPDRTSTISTEGSEVLVTPEKAPPVEYPTSSRRKARFQRQNSHLDNSSRDKYVQSKDEPTEPDLTEHHHSPRFNTLPDISEIQLDYLREPPADPPTPPTSTGHYCTLNISPDTELPPNISSSPSYPSSSSHPINTSSSPYSVNIGASSSPHNIGASSLPHRPHRSSSSSNPPMLRTSSISNSKDDLSNFKPLVKGKNLGLSKTSIEEREEKIRQPSAESSELSSLHTSMLMSDSSRGTVSFIIFK